MSMLINMGLVAAIAALVVLGGKIRARNPATSLEGRPPLTRRDKIMYFVGFALIGAVSAYQLFRG